MSSFYLYVGLGKTPLGGVLPLCDAWRHAFEVVVYLENKFYTNLLTGRVYNHTGYDVTTNFRSEVMAKNPSKMPPPTTLVEISQRFVRWPPNFTCLSGTIGPTNLLDMTSVASSVSFATLKMITVVPYSVKVIGEWGVTVFFTHATFHDGGAYLLSFATLPLLPSKVYLPSNLSSNRS